MGDADEFQWDDIRYFLAACRAGSMAGAARSLGVEQSTMSRRIKRLEHALGVALFERTPEGLRMTERALALKPHADVIADEIRGIRKAANEVGNHSVVRVAVTETMAELLLVPAMGEFLLAHPDVRLEICTGLELVDVLGGSADIAIRNVRPTSEQLVSRKVATLAFAPFAHRDYLRGLKSYNLSDLDWITVAVPEGARLPEAQWFAAHVAVPPRVTTSTFKAQIEAVNRGLGVGLITRAVAMAFSDLEELALEGPEAPTFELWLVTHHERRRLPHVRAVIDWLVDLCSQIEGPRAG